MTLTLRFLSVLLSLVWAAPSLAGSNLVGGPTGSSYSVEQQGSVTIYRGQHSTPNYAALRAHLAAEEAAKAQKARQAAYQSRLDALDAQTAELTELAGTLQTLIEESSKEPPKRRRVYYGNNRFFGPNGFYGNRYYSGAAPQTSYSRKRRGR